MLATVLSAAKASTKTEDKDNFIFDEIREGGGSNQLRQGGMEMVEVMKDLISAGVDVVVVVRAQTGSQGLSNEEGRSLK